MVFLKVFTLCTLLLGLISHPIFSQEEEAFRLFQSADSLFYSPEPSALSDSLSMLYFQKSINAFDQDSLRLQAEAHQKIGNLFEIQARPDSALFHYKLSLEKARNLDYPQDTLRFYANLYCGDAFQYLEFYDSAQYFYEQAEDIMFDNLAEKESARLFNSIGLLHFHLGNYQQAINYLEKGSSYLSNNPYASFIIRNNLAIAHDKLGQYKVSIPIYHSLLTTGDIPEAIYQNLGKAYSATERYDSAVLFLKKAAISNDVNTRMAACNNLAEVYAKRNLPDSAEFWYRKNIEPDQNLAQSFQNYFNKAGAYLGLARLSLAQEEAEDALHNFQYALINSSFDFEDKDYYQHPDDIFSGISLLMLFKIYEGKGNGFTLLYEQSNEIQDLENSFLNYELAIQLARYIQKTYDNDEAKLFLLQNIYSIYEKAIQAAHHLYQLSQEKKYLKLAFQFSEQSKASVLSEILNEVKIKTKLTVNDSLIQAEKRHKQQISQIRLQMLEMKDSSMSQALKIKLNDSEIQLSQTIRKLQKDEKFYHLKYQEDSLDIEDLQKNMLDGKDAFIEYFIGEDSLYCFLLSQEDFKLHVQAIDSSFYQAIEQLEAALYSYQMGEDYSSSQQSSFLYQKLIFPFEEDIQEKDRLIIVPDGQLNYIPLEILNNPNSKEPYLIQRFAFNYAYSARLLKDAITARKAKETNAVLAMAPFAGDEEGNIRSNGFSMLFGSKEEVENIGGSIYLENQATKRLFLDLASEYGVIHLATHASIDNTDPLQSFIAFYPQEDQALSGYRLYTQELYNLQLDSVNLVVLSACEAGNGQLVKGEGIISLARAFAYAGCPNIVTTLWKAQDKSTARIASSLHQYLKEGYTKDEALRMAKLDYLNAEDVHPLLKAPYYWANFIFIGDSAPIYERPPYVWWFLGALLMIFLIFWLVKKSVFQLKKP